MVMQVTIWETFIPTDQLPWGGRPKIGYRIWWSCNVFVAASLRCWWKISLPSVVLFNDSICFKILHRNGLRPLKRLEFSAE